MFGLTLLFTLFISNLSFCADASPSMGGLSYEQRLLAARLRIEPEGLTARQANIFAKIDMFITNNRLKKASRLLNIKKNKSFKPDIINARDRQRGHTLLIKNVMANKLDAVEFLIQNQADLDIQTPATKSTALILAIDGGYSDVAKMLINAKANVDLQDFEGRNALIKSMIKKRDNITKALIEATNNIFLEDNEGHGVIYYSLIYGSQAIQKLIRERFRAEFPGDERQKKEQLLKYMGNLQGIDLIGLSCAPPQLSNTPGPISIIDNRLTCANDSCEEQEQSKGDFKKCARCNIVFYCSKQCQISHWKSSHKTKCREAAINRDQRENKEDDNGDAQVLTTEAVDLEALAGVD